MEHIYCKKIILLMYFDGYFHCQDQWRELKKTLSVRVCVRTCTHTHYPTYNATRLLGLISGQPVHSRKLMTVSVLH